MGKQWEQWQTLFFGLQNPADGDCSHEIKRHLLLRRKAMTNLDSILNSRDITLPTKFHQSYVFSSMYVRVELSTEELMLLYCGVGEDLLGTSVEELHPWQRS